MINSDKQEQSNNATAQAINIKAGKGGVVPPVERQFGQPNGNPRNPSGWKKEDTARYKLEKMMKLSEDELRKVAADKEAPLFERKLATCIAKGQWKEIEGMINQVYGKPKESFEVKDITPPEPLELLKKKKK